MYVPTGTLLIVRKLQFVDRLRRYRIFVDGRQRGKVAAGDELRLNFPEGEYQLFAQMDWLKSNDMSVLIQNGEVTEIEVGSNGHWWVLQLLLFWSNLGYRRYLYLRHRSVGFPVITYDVTTAS